MFSDYYKVPNRFNYVLWIQDLIDTSSSTYSDQYDPKQEVIGLDIGTGASCIYPLLGCAQRPNWTFIGTGTLIRNCLSRLAANRHNGA
jgi:23S rRNA (adenine1618-N6)-methyltransferase